MRRAKWILWAVWAIWACGEKPENAKLFEKYGVMTQRELLSRHEIFLEEYSKKVRIEGACARDVACEMVFPAVKAEYLETVDAFSKAEALGIASGTSALRESVVELGAGLDALKVEIRKLEEAADQSGAKVLGHDLFRFAVLKKRS